MKVTYSVALKRDEIKNKLIEAIKYLTGTASGMFHGYQLFYDLLNYEFRVKDPISAQEKDMNFLVILNQYLDQMQLCTASGLLKKSPDIFNNKYYKYINIFFIFGKIFDQLEVDVGESKTTYSYDNEIRPPLSSIAHDFNDSVESLLIKRVNFDDEKEFFFDYRKLLLDLLRKCTQDYLSDDEFNAVNEEALNSLKTDRFLKTVMNVVHDEALHERTQYIYFNLNEWVCDSANYLIFPNVIFYLFQFLEDKSVKNLGLSFIENFIHYLTHDLYKPDETVVSLPDPSDLKNADDKTKEIGEKILKTTAEQMFTYENVIYSLQLGQVAGLFDINLPLVPPTVHKNLDIRQTEGKRLDIAYFPSYMEFEEFFIKQTADSQKKASLIIAREFTRTLETHKVKYIKYALNALILINEKPALAKYLKPSQKMQEDNCVPV
ncbi:MAG: hypothetical protein IJ254_09635 [Succinivibrio sp.]|nr:hypothetical protein [Succinivibrio sp.]